jgi:hypothetical protein
LWICQPQGMPPMFSAAMSSPTKTAFTPGMPLAAEVSSDRWRHGRAGCAGCRRGSGPDG